MSRVKFANFSFSKWVCSDSSQVWGEAQERASQRSWRAGTRVYP